MTDDEVIKKMTSTLRLIDEMLTLLYEIKENIEVTCPVCHFAYDVLKFDIAELETTREDLIQISTNSERDKKIIMMAKANCFTTYLTDKAKYTRAILDITHTCFSNLAKARVIEEIRERGLDETKMEAKEVCKIFERKFDPKKAN